MSYEDDREYIARNVKAGIKVLRIVVLLVAALAILKGVSCLYWGNY